MHNYIYFGVQCALLQCTHICYYGLCLRFDHIAAGSGNTAVAAAVAAAVVAAVVVVVAAAVVAAVAAAAVDAVVAAGVATAGAVAATAPVS